MNKKNKPGFARSLTAQQFSQNYIGSETPIYGNP